MAKPTCEVHHPSVCSNHPPATSTYCSLADSLFQQCYKPNARLLAPQGEELQRVRAAANRHAALVLDIRCGCGVLAAMPAGRLAG